MTAMETERRGLVPGWPLALFRIAFGLMYLDMGLQKAPWVVTDGHRYGWLYDGYWRSAVAPAPTVVYEPPPPPPQPVPVATAPPAPIVEVRPPGPFAGALWIPGYWHWDGARHVWTAGVWSAPRAGFAWEPHRWHAQGGHWTFAPGHWRRL